MTEQEVPAALREAQTPEKRDLASDALATLFERLAPRFNQIRRHYNIDAETGRDILQESMLRFIQVTEPIDKPAGWLVNTFRNECVRHIEKRSHSRERKVELAIRTSNRKRDRTASGELFVKEVLRTICDLPKEDRLAIEGRYFRELSADELADKLQVAPSTTKNRVSRALSKLRSRLFLQRLPRRN